SGNSASHCEGAGSGSSARARPAVPAATTRPAARATPLNNDFFMSRYPPRGGASAQAPPVVVSLSPQGPSGRAAALPDPDPILGLQVELVALLHPPGVVPGVDVAQRPVDPEARGRVDVGGDLLLQRVEPVFRAPGLRIAQEETLVAGVSVDHR